RQGGHHEQGFPQAIPSDIGDGPGSNDGAISGPIGSARAAGKELIPRKLPFPPNDEFCNYEPTITTDGNTIYFARFANTGDKRVRGKGPISSSPTVSAKAGSGRAWPGTGRRRGAVRTPSTPSTSSIRSRGSPRMARRSTSRAAARAASEHPTSG